MENETTRKRKKNVKGKKRTIDLYKAFDEVNRIPNKKNRKRIVI